MAAAVAVLLARRGVKRGSLSSSGAAAALVVGLLSMASSYRFGATLLLFYFTSSKLTKFGSARKQQLEEGVEEGEGKRSHVQVLSCSAVGVALALAHVWRFGVDGDHAAIAGGDLWSARLRVAYLAHFAACTADTWASELGILGPGKPFLMLSMRSCPPGTNGAVSTRGNLAALGGGAFAGAVFGVGGWAQGGDSLAALPVLVVVGAVTGFFGSTVDSILGETLQESWLSPSKKVCGHGLPEGADANEYKLICGRAVLSNEQVNVASVVAASLLGAALAPYTV